MVYQVAKFWRMLCVINSIWGENFSIVHHLVGKVAKLYGVEIDLNFGSFIQYMQKEIPVDVICFSWFLWVGILFKKKISCLSKWQDFLFFKQPKSFVTLRQNSLLQLCLIFLCTWISIFCWRQKIYHLQCIQEGEEGVSRLEENSQATETMLLSQKWS